MKLIVLIFLSIFSFTICIGQSKRGVAYGHHSANDLEVLSPEVSWWYNWSEVPESSVSEVYMNYGFDFVPMTWNGNFNQAKLRQFLSNHPQTKYLLAFNEPNFLEQANMTPSQVAAKWSIIESIADDFNLKIVGPAVNYCGDCVEENGVTYTDPFKYLDDFFAACPDCRVDYIAVHSYMNSVSALEWYIGEFKKYGKPIWLTEFAGWEPNGNINNLNDQINFMIGAVDFLETDPDVFRYSWFIGRGSGISNYPYIDLLGADGVLTELGQVYKQMPVHNENQIIEIPGLIEAEKYNKMSGILLEKTSDQSGFANVGYIDAGGWLEYKINVTENNSYDIHFRIASTKSSSLNVLVDGVNLLNQNFTNTGGWQVWSTVKNRTNLTSGVHIIRLQAVTDGFNLNWIQIGALTTNVNKINNEHMDFTIYPNPNNGIFTIRTNNKIDKIQFSNMTGSIISTLKYSETINASMLPKGVYLLKALDKLGNVLITKHVFIN